MAAGKENTFMLFYAETIDKLIGATVKVACIDKTKN
jgi:hypothetical protein